MTLYAKPFAKQAWAMALKAMGLSKPLVVAASTVAGGATAAAAGSIVSQGVGVATGIQDKFSWNAVAMAAISGGVGASRIGDKIAAVFARADTALHAAISAGASSALSQGVGMAVGMQSKFDWAGVAGAAAGAAMGHHIGARMDSAWAADHPNLAQLTTGMASNIANATTRTLIDGSDFGDNMLAGIADTLGQLVGARMTDGAWGAAKRSQTAKGIVGAAGGCETLPDDVVWVENPDSMVWVDPAKRPFVEILPLRRRDADVEEGPDIIVTAHRTETRDTPDVSETQRALARAGRGTYWAARRREDAQQYQDELASARAADRANSAAMAGLAGRFYWNVAQYTPVGRGVGVVRAGASFVSRGSNGRDIAPPMPPIPPSIPPDVESGPMVTYPVDQSMGRTPPREYPDPSIGQTPPLEHPDYDFGPLVTPIPNDPELYGPQIYTRNSPEPIGAFPVPEGLRYGTGPFGDYAHEQVAQWYRRQFPDVEFEFRVRRGEQGIDITVVNEEDIPVMGFHEAEIKPNTSSGERRYNEQLAGWNRRPSQVQVITYDADGNIRYGFHH